MTVVRVDVHGVGSGQSLKLGLELFYAVDADGHVFATVVPENVGFHHRKVVFGVEFSIVHDGSFGSKPVFSHLIGPSSSKAPSHRTHFRRVHFWVRFEILDGRLEVVERGGFIAGNRSCEPHGRRLIGGGRFSV